MKRFLSCGSPYRSSHIIGRSMSGLRPCCCHSGGREFVSSHYFWNNEWCKNLQNKSRQIPQQTRLCGARSGLPQLCSWVRAIITYTHPQCWEKWNRSRKQWQYCAKHETTMITFSRWLKNDGKIPHSLDALQRLWRCRCCIQQSGYSNHKLLPLALRQIHPCYKWHTSVCWCGLVRGCGHSGRFWGGKCPWKADNGR